MHAHTGSTACIHVYLSHCQVLCCLPPCRLDHYVLFEGVWAVHTTVIIAADRREARSELGTAL